MSVSSVVNCSLSAASMSGGVVNVAMESVKGGKSEEVQCDVLLVCVGRKPYTDNLGLEVTVSSEIELVSNSGSTVWQNVGISLDERGRIPVDAHLRTSVNK